MAIKPPQRQQFSRLQNWMNHLHLNCLHHLPWAHIVYVLENTVFINTLIDDLFWEVSSDHHQYQEVDCQS